MTTDETGSTPTLPGLEHAKGDGAIRRAFSRSIDALREKDLILPEHEGLCAMLLRLADALDDPRAKGYSIAQTSAQAHDIMQTLLELDTSDETDDSFEKLLRDIQVPKA